MIQYPIFLMGYMSSGKSSLGKKVARHLEVDFIDLDQQIEELEASSIHEIFQQKGESHFRKLEAKMLRDLTKGQKAVISLGGGTPCYLDNINFIKQCGTSLYLEVPAEVLIGRLREKKESRPLIAQLSNEELSAFVKEQLEARKVFYQQADIIFSAENKPKAKELVKALSLGF